MKIAILNISQDLVDRGAETFVLEVAKRLSENHRVDIFGGKSLPPSRWPVLWRLFLDPQGIVVAVFTLKLLPKIWKEKYDIVVPVNGGWQPALIRLTTWLYGGKMVISGQSGMGWDERNNLWCFPDVFIALSESAKLWATKAMPFVKVLVIPNGVDLMKFKPEGKRIKLSLPRPVILCVAALTPTKRIDLTIKAVSKLKKGSLLLVGDGELGVDLKKLGRRLLGERFRLLSVPFDKMPSVYRSADLFTLPSESYYSFEIAIVEALASGLGVVVNNDAIRKSIVGNAGVLVDPVRINSYTRSLEEALMKKWREDARRRVLDYDWSRISDKYEAVMKSLF